MKKIYQITLLLALLLCTLHLVGATTPNPGHPWSQVGDGTFQISGPTTMRTYTLPDTNATLLDRVTMLQGGTGFTSSVQGDFIYGSTTPNTFAALAKDTNATRYIANTGTSNGPAWAQVSLTTGITGILPGGNGGTNNAFMQFSGPATSTKTFTLPDADATILTSNAPVTFAQGGTGANIVASNGGIFYSGASVATLLAPTATAGQILRSGASAAPTWSTATYPATAGTSGNFLASDGTNFVSTVPPSIKTAANRSINSTGAVTTGTALSSLTVYDVSMFSLGATITLNQLAYNVGANTTGTYRLCIYSEDGQTKHVDVTDVPAVGVNTVAVSSVVLAPGNYYMAMGCAVATCASTIDLWTSTAIAMSNGASIPSGKKPVEGTYTMASGTCDATITPTSITGGNTKTPIWRLDN